MAKHLRRSALDFFAVLPALGTLLFIILIMIVLVLAGGGLDKQPLGVSLSPTPSQTLTMTPVIPDPETLSAGLRVSGSVSPTPSSSVPAPSTSPAPKTVRYVVKPGDTLTSIGAEFNLEGWKPLYAWNVTSIGQDPGLIHPGLVLIVAIS